MKKSLHIISHYEPLHRVLGSQPGSQEHEGKYYKEQGADE